MTSQSELTSCAQSRRRLASSQAAVKPVWAAILKNAHLVPVTVEINRLYTIVGQFRRKMTGDGQWKWLLTQLSNFSILKRPKRQQLKWTKQNLLMPLNFYGSCLAYDPAAKFSHPFRRENDHKFSSHKQRKIIWAVWKIQEKSCFKSLCELKK